MNDLLMRQKAVKSIVPFGMPFYDKQTGGIPSESVTLVRGGPVMARAAIGVVFAAAQSTADAPSLIVGGTAESLSTRFSDGGTHLSSVGAPASWLEISRDHLAPADAVETWKRVLAKANSPAPARIVLNQADLWFSFVPDHLVEESAELLLQELRSLSSQVLVSHPEVSSKKSAAVVAAFSKGADVRIHLAGDKARHSVRWLTEDDGGQGINPVADLDEATVQEIRTRATVPEQTKELSLFRPDDQAVPKPQRPAPNGTCRDAAGNEGMSFSRLMNVSASDWSDDEN